MSLRKKKKNKHAGVNLRPGSEEIPSDNVSVPLSESLGRMRIRNDSPGSSGRRSTGSDHSGSTPSLSRKGRHKKCGDIEMGIKNVEVVDNNTELRTVEVLKRPGQTLGFFITEGNGLNVKKGVFISRMAEGSIVQQNGLLKIGDEILAINSVNVTRTNLDDVVVLMSIPKRLILTIKTRRSLPQLSGSDYIETRAPYIQKQHSQDCESLKQYQIAVDLNTEGSNDSGLSSEHSLRGDRTTSESHQLPRVHASNARVYTARPADLRPAEPVYDRPSPLKTELCVSDCEHEYNPPSRPCSSRNGGLRKTVSQPSKQKATRGNDAYNSDSELLPKYQSNHLASQQRIPWSHNGLSNGANSVGTSETPCSTLKPPGFSSEMQHWLRKFDHMSEELQSSTTHSDSPGKFFSSTVHSRFCFRLHQLIRHA